MERSSHVRRRFGGLLQHGSFDLFSYGADEKEGGEGEDQDINSWE